LRDNLQVKTVDPHCPDPAVIEEASDSIKRGKLVIFPTLCLYGLGADALDCQAVNRVFAAKNRPANNPVSIIIPDMDMLPEMTADIPDAARKVIARFWPGSITLIFKASPHLPSCLTADTATIGIRLPAHPVAAALVKTAGRPVTATSANKSGQPGAWHVHDISRDVARAAEIILDAGKLLPGTGSTILDVSCDPPAIIRQGAVSLEKVREVLPGVVLNKTKGTQQE
jgi:L-threonylcarbamoyladenylate synthase